VRLRSKFRTTPLLIGFRKIQPSLVALPQDDLDTEVAGKLRDQLVVVANLRELLRLTRCEFVLFTLSVDRNEEVLFPIRQVRGVLPQSVGQGAEAFGVLSDAVNFLPRPPYRDVGDKRDATICCDEAVQDTVIRLWIKKASVLWNLRFPRGLADRLWESGLLSLALLLATICCGRQP